MPEKEDVIQVVLAVYDPNGTYSRHAGVVATSIFSNTRSKVNITILHDATLTDDNKRRFEQTAERWNQNVSFIDVSEHISRISEGPDIMTSVYSRGSLFRLLIPELLSFSKVIYLDCDVVVNLDIFDLWNIKLDDFSLAVVRHFPKKSSFHVKIRKWALRYTPENYFFSGVLLMNLQKIKGQHNLVQNSFSFFQRYRHITEFPDQDFLNVFFQRDVLFLEERFNRVSNCVGIDIYVDIDGAILHFANCNPRPWITPHNTPRDDIFWHFLLESEWRDQLGEVIASVFQNKPLEHYHSIECVNLLLRRILRRLYYDKCLRLLKDFRIVLMELFCRLTRKNFAPDYEERL